MGRRGQEIDWEESAEERYERYRTERELHRRPCLQVLWLVRQGRSATAAATEAGGSADGAALAGLVAGWRAGGGAAVSAGTRGTGAACWLSPEQRATLLAPCRRGAFRTYGEAQRWVTRECGVSYRYDGLPTLLTRLGVPPQGPRPTAAKADPVVQEAWKKGTYAYGTR
jgi:transposase